MYEAPKFLAADHRGIRERAHYVARGCVEQVGPAEIFAVGIVAKGAQQYIVTKLGDGVAEKIARVWARLGKSLFRFTRCWIE